MIDFICDKKQKLSKIVLHNYSDISYSTIQKLLRSKDIKLNGKRINKDVELIVGDRVQIYFNPTKKDKYEILYKDDNVIVIDKKSGYTSEDVYNALLSEFSCAKFIHRLDRNTAGVMIFALNESSENQLLSGFKNRSFEKFYSATVFGKMPKKQDVLTAYLAKDEKNSIVKIFDKKVDGSTLIKTGYEVVNEYEDTSLLKVKLYTGKTHQIRAHLAHIGHFILGDGKYGDNEFNRSKGVKSQKLVAKELKLFFSQGSSLDYLDNKSFYSKQDWYATGRFYP